MRRNTIICMFVVLTACIIVYQLINLSIVIRNTRYFYPHPTSQFTEDEYKAFRRKKGTLIPKILHQIWLTTTEDTIFNPDYNSHWLWRMMYKNRDWEIKLWTKDKIDDLINTDYPWLEQIYQSYSKDIQKADFARYLIVYHEGGVYIDLDAFPTSTAIRDLLKLEFFATQTTDKLFLSNHFFGAKKNHNFFQYVLLNIHKNKLDIWLPYLSVFYTTGPLLFTKLYDDYRMIKPFNQSCEAILTPSESNNYIKHKAGRVWLSWDGIFVNLIADQIGTKMTFLVLLLIGIFSIIIIYRIVTSRRKINK